MNGYMAHMKTYYSLETMKPFAHGQSIWYECQSELSQRPMDTQAGFSGVDTLTYLSKITLDHQSHLDNKHDFKDIFSCKVIKLNQKNYFDTKIIFIMALFEKLLRMEDVALFLDRLSVYSGKTGLSINYRFRNATVAFGSPYPSAIGAGKNCPAHLSSPTFQ